MTTTTKCTKCGFSPLPTGVCSNSYCRAKTLTQSVRLIMICLGIMLGAWSLGYWSRGYIDSRQPALEVQDANDLLKAGFTITDPEGFEIAGFDPWKGPACTESP